MSTRKLMILSVMFVLIGSLAPAGLVLAKGKPPVESTNNLSFHVIWSEGVKLTLSGTTLNAILTVPYDVNRDGIVTETDMLDCNGTFAYAYAQKTVGNVWQAENVVATEPVYVSEVDWGDSLESLDMKVGRLARMELSLYKILDLPLTSYTMVMLANPSSPHEVQGACATTNPGGNETVLTYPSYEATVYSPYGKLVIQKITGTNLTWDGSQWTGDAGAPVNISFAGELNVGGKVIYGLSTGGWKPAEIGEYRLTFYLPTSGKTLFDTNTSIRLAAETETAAIPLAEEGGEVGGVAVVDWEHNLTYIDITVVRK